MHFFEKILQTLNIRLRVLSRFYCQTFLTLNLKRLRDGPPLFSVSENQVDVHLFCGGSVRTIDHIIVDQRLWK